MTKDIFTYLNPHYRVLTSEKYHPMQCLLHNSFPLRQPSQSTVWLKMAIEINLLSHQNCQKREGKMLQVYCFHKGTMDKGKHSMVGSSQSSSQGQGSMETASQLPLCMTMVSPHRSNNIHLVVGPNFPPILQERYMHPWSLIIDCNSKKKLFHSILHSCRCAFQNLFLLY